MSTPPRSRRLDLRFTLDLLSHDDGRRTLHIQIPLDSPESRDSSDKPTAAPPAKKDDESVN